MAIVSERLQSAGEVVADDDSALVGDAHAMRIDVIAWPIVEKVELEQERAIDQRQYLHSMALGLGDDDSMSIIVDRDV